MNKQVQRKREQIIDEIKQIERLRQGTISEQYYGTGDNKKGPYYVLQGYTEGKHWSKRIPKDQINQVRKDIKTGVHLKELYQDFADITEQATLKQNVADSKKNDKKRQ